jgi:hypothetical protein
LEKSDKAALEAGNLAFVMAREIMERTGCEERVLNSAKLPFIWGAPTKTDKEEAMKLAHLVEERRDGKLPVAPLPGEKELEHRKTLASYGRGMKNRTRYINTLHAIFVHQGHTTVVRKNLATAERREEAVRILKYLELHGQRIKELKDRIHKEAKNDEDMKNLQTIPGAGPVVASDFSPLLLQLM